MSTSPRTASFYISDEAEGGTPNEIMDCEFLDRKIIVGVCAMAKKSGSKPMKEILHRLLEHFERLEILIFEESVILNDPIEKWPIVDAFISFFSYGFPLDKAIAYSQLRKPYVINDLEMQHVLKDRREVYKVLQVEGIPHPRYAVLNRDLGSTEAHYQETDDAIEVNGVLFPKPFVEKPVDAEDHNVYIFFPVQAGGGSTRLFRKQKTTTFRKVKDRSSVYGPHSRVRKVGSYIYEDFMPTDGTDVKVYTVGLDYAHAEARKSPALDGKVERDRDGKEIRYPVLLSAKEKLIARKVCIAFKQNVCGFDLLRTSGQSYVCDVNGFSFVKTSSKYYDDSAKILGTMIMREVAPQLQLPWILGCAPEDLPVVPTASGSMMELRCVVAVVRHGDRTPKQKMKMEVKHKKFFDLFEKYGGMKNGHLKLKKPKQLQEVLDVVRHLLSNNQKEKDPEVEEKKVKFQQLKLVLEMYGHFSGINRKVQIKYQPRGCPKRSSSEEDLSTYSSDAWFEYEVPREPSLLLIVKWGGELTPAGKIQAEELGKAFRTLYPGGQDNFSGQFETPGLGFLRLHSTFRHDLKMYASDEGRVQMTAAAFIKGLLALEGELTPIMVQMVKSANTNGLLDSEGLSSKYQIVVKEKLKDIFNQDKDFTEEDYKKLAPTGSVSLINAMKFVKNPKEMCDKVHAMVKEITALIRSLKIELKSRDLKLYHGESWELFIRRWAKLEKDFKLKNGRYDISKIPDIYDCIKYDLQHNKKTLQYEGAEELFMCCKALADIIIPQEYGITVEEKLHIAQNFSNPLIRKIRSDFAQCEQLNQEDDSTRLDSRYSKGVSTPERFVRTRLYFTSESHIHSLLTILRYGSLCDEAKDEQWKRAMDYINATSELNYMTQIVLMMFEDPSKDPTSEERYHMELHFSPGAYTSCDTSLTSPRGMGYRPKPKTDKKDNKDDVIKESTSLQGSCTWEGSLYKEQLKPRLSRSDPQTSYTTPGIKCNLGEILESDLYEQDTVDHLNVENSSSKTLDSSIPEWDWGETDDKQQEKTRECKPQPTGTCKSEPIPCVKPVQITVDPVSSQDSSKPQSLDEKRSRSLDDDKKSDEITTSNTNGSLTPLKLTFVHGKDKTKPRYLHSFSSELSATLSEPIPYVHRHYQTVHLPLNSDRHRHSCSSLFYLNTNALKAFEGFNMVPSIKPLETLHNSLTFRAVDDFLHRTTTNRFLTPLASPPYNHDFPAGKSLPLTVPNKIIHSLPSSCSSSAGPSSPTSASTPVDIIQKLKMFMVESQGSRSDGDTDSSSSSQNRQDQYVSDSNIDPFDFSLLQSVNSSSVSSPDNNDRFTVKHVDDSLYNTHIVSAGGPKTTSEDIYTGIHRSDSQADSDTPDSVTIIDSSATDLDARSLSGIPPIVDYTDATLLLCEDITQMDKESKDFQTN
ncbi:inositol hexakisphosphate and diphosphoinositol-pentakisphosphate kinase 2 isoform X5 [Patella vulgata]|uniref:inositol hexakisphosphate and diphosphoinositol-pentakisphosphate kinase 2 isoform X5 n=1 Tax=Patella vulgata TaxID=6465 RepID=UPI0024A80F1F|nr:inositol hexakisphosphate and diphosphoinositol-pentakisphosphate kinase 2 isoform X5 [Patella vulgata]